MSQRFLKTIPLITGVLLLSILFSYLVLAWTSPSQPPPEGNVPAPINVGTSPQAKMGDLKLANLYLNATGNEGNIYAIDQLIGYNDLRLKSTSNEGSPIYYGASTHRFFTGGTERLTILNNGNVGIGTTNPAARLHIYDSFRGNMKLLTTSGVGHDFGYDGGSDSAFWFTHTGAESGYTLFRWDNGVSSRNLVYIGNNGNVGIGGTTAPGNKLVVAADAVPAGDYDTVGQFAIRGSTNSNNVVIIGYDTTNNYGWIQPSTDNTAWRNLALNPGGGNVGIGTTNPAYKLDVFNDLAVGTSGWTRIRFYSSVNDTYNPLTGGSDTAHFHFGFPGTPAGKKPLLEIPADLWIIGGDKNLKVDGSAAISGNVGIGTTNPGNYKLKVNGSMYADSYNCASDINKKTNLQKLERVLEKISEINGYYFNWKNGPDGKRQIGLVAQEVEKFFPELVTTTKTENGEEKALDYSRMTAILLEAIKEQQAEIEKLKAEIERLKK